jgi:hypothetical protein
VAGAAFAELLKSKGVTGKCIELQGALTDVNAVNPSKGWNEAASKGGITTVIQVPTEWNPELFRSVLTNALKAKPEANCVCLRRATLRTLQFRLLWKALAVTRRPATQNMFGLPQTIFFRLR